MRVGVDGCKKGWFYVQLGDKDWKFGVVTELSLLLDSLPDDSVVLVDIPIGLREAQGEGGRLCDIEARKALGPKKSPCVFSAPCRQAVYASSYAEASDTNKRILDRKLSKQSWAITSKIREVDELFQGSRRTKSMVREVHPELCFSGLSGAPMHHSKKKREGFRERLKILAEHFPESVNLADKALLQYRRYEVARDDILDALVAAYCASRIGDCSTLPGEPEIDPRGLRMEMVYLPQGAL